MKKTLLTFVTFFTMMSMALAQTFTWTSADWTGVVEKAQTISLVAGDFTFTANQEQGSNAPTVNGTTKDLRIYANGSLNVASTKNFSQVVFNLSKKGTQRLAEITADAGKVAIDTVAATVTWIGDAKSVTLSVGAKAIHGTDGPGAAGQFCVASIVVGKGGGTVDPTPNPNPDPQPTETVFYASDFGAGVNDFVFEDKAAYTGVWTLDSRYGGMLKASAFTYDDNVNHPSDSWAISPVIDLTKATKATLSYVSTINFFGQGNVEFAKACSVNVRVEGQAEMKALTVSGEYDASKWSKANCTADLSAYVGKKIQLIYAYTSTDQVAGTWQVKDVKVAGEGEKGEVTPQPEPTLPTYETIADLKANAAVTEVKVVFNFKDLLVTGVVSTNKKNLYLSDGNEAILVYGGDPSKFEVGQVVSGSIEAGLKDYHGTVELVNPDFSKVTIAADKKEVVPAELTIADIVNNDGYKKYQNVLATVKNLTFVADTLDNHGNVALLDDTDSEITIHDSYKVLGDLVIDMNSPYDVTGIVAKYEGYDGTVTYQLVPLAKEDVKIITNLKEPATAWANPEVVIEAGAEWTVANEFTTTSDGQVTYTSSNEAVATVDAEGKVTVKGFGIAEISAETAETSTFLAGKASFNVVVLEGKGTLEAPFTPADVQYQMGKVADAVWVVGELAGFYDNNAFVEGATDKVASNIALRMNGVVLPVQLPSKSSVRAGLNLMDNPTLLNKKVYVYGKLEKYFSVAGVKSTSDFSLDGVTGIESVESENGAQVIYDLSGRRVAKAVKGLYIINGKKVFVK